MRKIGWKLEGPDMSKWEHRGSLDIFEKPNEPEIPGWAWIVLILFIAVVVLN